MPFFLTKNLLVVVEIFKVKLDHILQKYLNELMEYTETCPRTENLINSCPNYLAANENCS